MVTSVKRLALTPFTIDIPQGIHHCFLTKKFKKANILTRFNRTAWGKKLYKRELKEQMSDFERFVAMKKHRASYYNPPKKTRTFKTPTDPKLKEMYKKIKLAKRHKKNKKTTETKGKTTTKVVKKSGKAVKA